MFAPPTLQVHNDDGVWLRLSPDSMRDWCDGIGAAASGNTGLPEAWCLQYNQHLGKTLLAPVEEPRSIVDEMVKEALARKLPEYIRGATQSPKHAPKGQGQMLKCSLSCHFFFLLLFFFFFFFFLIYFWFFIFNFQLFVFYSSNFSVDYFFCY